MRVAVIDIGSNSIKALVAEPGAVPGSVEPVFERTLEVRISHGIGADNGLEAPLQRVPAKGDRLKPVLQQEQQVPGLESPLQRVPAKGDRLKPVLQQERMAAGTQAVAELWADCRRHGPVAAVRIVATSAVRSAANGREFLAAVSRATGVEAVALSGEEEALAIACGVQTDPALAGKLRDFTVLDLGGGSLELIRFVDGAVQARTSLPLGSVRLTERFVADAAAALNQDEQRLLARHVRASLEDCGFPLEPPLVGCGGGLNVLRSLFGHQDDPDASTGGATPSLPRVRIVELEKHMLAMTLNERIDYGIPPGRADIFPAAMVTLRVIMELSGAAEILHSFRNLRFGLARELLEHG